MSQADAVYDFFTGDPGVAAIIGDRFYRRGMLPQGASLPACTMLRVGGPREFSHSGDSNLAHPRWQISCWAGADAQAEALARAVIRACNGWHGAYGGAALPSEPVDVPQPETGVVQLAVDVQLWWKE